MALSYSYYYFFTNGAGHAGISLLFFLVPIFIVTGLVLSILQFIMISRHKLRYDNHRNLALALAWSSLLVPIVPVILVFFFTAFD